MKSKTKYFQDAAGHETILQILKNSLSMLINDVTEEGEEGDRHIIVTLDLEEDDSYKLVRVDVTDLGPDTLKPRCR
jgi:hypothetical protein